MATNTPLSPCRKCGAVMDCCAMSKMRSDTAKSLARLVDRQSATITTLTNEIRECRQIVAELRGKNP